MSVYTDMITSQHRGKEKFESIVSLDTLAFSDIAELLATLPSLYDLDVAVGVQLDTVGEWIGLSRYIGTQLAGVYFSFDDTELGLDAGIWKGPFDPLTGLTRLDDESYRLALRAKIGANHWEGSAASLQAILNQIFTGYDTSVFIGDHQDMSISYYLVGPLPAQVIVSLLTGGYLSIKPAGVQIRGYFKPSTDSAPILGLDCSGDYVAGLDSGSLAVAV